MTKREFWETTTLGAMTLQEWESLCDGCGRCCVHKIEEEETQTIYYTNVACRLLDTYSCRCTDYADRQRQVPDCVCLSPQTVRELNWLPSTCAYRLVAQGQALPSWHPLISDNLNSVHEAGISVRDRLIKESEAGDLEDHIVDEPL